MVNGKILSPHYNGPTFSSGSPINIDKKDYKSHIHLPLHTPILISDNGHSYVAYKTTNNIFKTTPSDFKQYGFFSQVDDGVFQGNTKFSSMGDWIANGTDNYPDRKSNKPIHKMPDFVYITGRTELGLYLPNKTDTQVKLYATPEIANAVDPNKVGYYESKVANLQQLLRNTIFNEKNEIQTVSARWIKFLSDKGFSVETADTAGVLGLGVQHGDFYAAYYPSEGFLMAGANLHEWSKELISKYGLKGEEATEAMKQAIYLHEIAHVLGVKGNYKGERLQGKLQEEFFSKLAQEHKGTKESTIYKALAQEGRDYASHNTLINHLLSSHDHNPAYDMLIHKFESDGKALGFKGEDLHDYVEYRAQESVGAILGGEPSAKSKSRKSIEKSSARAENLEARVLKAVEGASDNSEAQPYTSAPSRALTLIKGGRYSETYESGKKSEYNGNKNSRIKSLKERISESGKKADEKAAEKSETSEKEAPEGEAPAEGNSAPSEATA